VTIWEHVPELVAFALNAMLTAAISIYVAIFTNAGCGVSGTCGRDAMTTAAISSSVAIFTNAG